MNKKFCDICNKELTDYKQEVKASYGLKLMPNVFCLSCGKPVFNFLKKHGFIEKKK